MTDCYVDNRCRYLGGFPDLPAFNDATVEITSDALRLSLQTAGPPATQDLIVGRSRMISARYEEQHLGMEQAEIEEDELIGDHEWLIRHTVVLVVTDPADVMPGGLRIRLGFRNEYYARLCAKRCIEMLGSCPF
jgi:hypothetical protein